MTASFVSKSTMLSQAWQNVYDIVNNKSYVADPTTVSTQSRKWIYSREPDIKAMDFQEFPYIIVNPATLSFGKLRSGNRQLRSVSWSIIIEVVTCDRGFSNSDGKGMTHLDVISDDIIEAFNNETVQNTLRANGLLGSTPNVTAAVAEDFSNTKIYRRSIALTFAATRKVF